MGINQDHGGAIPRITGGGNMTILDILETSAYKTTITVRLFSFDKNGNSRFDDTVLSFDNVGAFSNYSIHCLVATGKDELLIELA